MSIPDDYIGEPGYPAPWTTSTPREGLRDTDKAIIVSLAPDVCKSPGTPVPYPVVDFCGHDENYTPSVRFTGQKAMVMRSNTSHVHGDEPGIGKGVVSNTVGGISEPIEHAAQIRAEGSHVIRHLDRFHMNNRNTVGEAVFVRDTRSYAAPADDDPLPGSIRLADASGGWAQYAQAQAAPAQPRQGAARPSARPSAPAPRPSVPPARSPGQVITPDFPQWKRPPPSMPKPEGLGPKLLRWGKWGVRLGGAVGVLTMLFEPTTLGDGTLPDWFHDLRSPDPVRRRTAEEANRRYRANPALRPELEEWYGDEVRGRPQPAPSTRPVPTPQAVPDNVRVDEDEPDLPCLVGPYEEISKICPAETHHIVPDMAYRLGRRPITAAEKASTENRIPNAPTLNEGMSICLTETQHGRSNDGLHGQIRAAFAELSTTVPGTAPMSEILRVSVSSIDSIVGLDPDCKRRAKVAATAQVVAKTGMTAPGRTREKPLPSGRAKVVLERGYY